MVGSLAWVVSIRPPYIIIVLVTRPSRVLYLAVISFKTFKALTPLQDSGSRVGCFKTQDE